MAKPKLAIYWAASCGGCDIAILDIEEKILDVVDFFDVVFWPCAMDFKYDDVRKMEDKSITLTLFNGAIRSDENYEIGRTAAAEIAWCSCAFGSCAGEGCIPGWPTSSTRSRSWTMSTISRRRSPIGGKVVPQPEVQVPEGTHAHPEILEHRSLAAQVVDVDYIIPGCPPQSDQIVNAVMAVIDILQNDKPLPPKGTVLGATDKSCCDECPRERNIKKIKKLHRGRSQVVTDPNLCLMEQGIVCLGPATRSGCGAKCVKAGVPCRGCYGLPSNINDQGAKMASALASVIDSTDPEEIEQIINTIPDPLGTFYRFSMAGSLLRRVQV